MYSFLCPCIILSTKLNSGSRTSRNHRGKQDELVLGIVMKCGYYNINDTEVKLIIVPNTMYYVHCTWSWTSYFVMQQSIVSCAFTYTCQVKNNIVVWYFCTCVTNLKVRLWICCI